MLLHACWLVNVVARMLARECCRRSGQTALKPLCDVGCDECHLDMLPSCHIRSSWHAARLASRAHVCEGFVVLSCGFLSAIRVLLLHCVFVRLSCTLLWMACTYVCDACMNMRVYTRTYVCV